MGLTTEQTAVVSKAVELYKDIDPHILTVAAVAGAGKTHTLVELTKTIQPTSGLYLAYNKAIQLEASEKFKDTNIICKTLHGLAYRYTVKPYGLSVKDFTYRDITEKLKFKDKVSVVGAIEAFLASSEINIHSFLEEIELDTGLKDLAISYYEKMLSGEIGGGHGLYLKLYHMLLADGTIEVPELDLLLLDEFGDITALTLEIFKLLKAKLKVAVGDSGQNIYSFTHTINGFKALEGAAVSLKLTQSFRVSKGIAKRVQAFANRAFDPDMVFLGTDNKRPTTFRSIAYIARTNSGMIRHMLKCEEAGVKFVTTRNPIEIFGLVLAIGTLSSTKEPYNPKFKWLTPLAVAYEKLSEKEKKEQSLFKYILDKNNKDINVVSAISLIQSIGVSTIFRIFNLAKSYYADNNNYKVTLTTAHSCKGLEFDSVTILDDLNEIVANTFKKVAKADEPTDAMLEEFRLYYVAISRCMFELNNAVHAKQG